MGEHGQYLYKVMTTTTTTRAAIKDRKNLDCKGWDNQIYAANTSASLLTSDKAASARGWQGCESMEGGWGYGEKQEVRLGLANRRKPFCTSLASHPPTCQHFFLLSSFTPHASPSVQQIPITIHLISLLATSQPSP